MKPDPRFLGQGKAFWANVRTISQQVGYTDRRTGQIYLPTRADVQAAFSAIGLTSDHLLDSSGIATAIGQALFDYFAYRAAVLNDFVRPHLMNVAQARDLFNELYARLRPTC